MNNPTAVVRIKLQSLYGDPDLYVGNFEKPFPRKERDCWTWSKAEFGDDSLSIFFFDRKFVPGYMYIGVYGATRAGFSIKVSWTLPGVGTGDLKQRGKNTTGSGSTKQLQEFDIVKLVKNRLKDHGTDVNFDHSMINVSSKATQNGDGLTVCIRHGFRQEASMTQSRGGHP